MFSAVDKRVAGYTGVDNLTGGYETSGDGLKLGQMASTLRAGLPEERARPRFAPCRGSAPLAS